MKCKIEFSMDNAAFEDDPGGEAKQIILAVAECIIEGDKLGKCCDSNGNTVGTWKITGK